MKIYLDACAIQRPLDTPNQVRIALESEAVLGIFALCEKGEIELISSEVLVYEMEQIPFIVRKEHAQAILSKASGFIHLSDGIKSKAENFVEIGIQPIDALHLASACEEKVDYFCTCDDKLLQRSSNIFGLCVKVVSPVELIKEIKK